MCFAGNIHIKSLTIGTAMSQPSVGGFVVLHDDISTAIRPKASTCLSVSSEEVGMETTVMINIRVGGAH